MSQERRIAVVTAADGYDGLLRALDERRKQLKASQATLGAIAGLAEGQLEQIYAGMKGLGRTSLGPTLGAHAIQIWIMEDIAALRQIARRLEPRDERQAAKAEMRAMRRIKLLPWIFSSEKARETAQIRWSKTSKKRRTAGARKAANARWKRVRQLKRQAKLQQVDVNCAGYVDNDSGAPPTRARLRTPAKAPSA